MKKDIGKLDAVPSKRLFLSIIADYDLNRSICELVDNGLDVWVRAGRKRSIAIDVSLNLDQKTITVKDNAGGLAKKELRYIVGPGQTGSVPDDETIGIFGVGTKRAVVALAQDVKITTRYGKEQTHEIDFDDKWLQTEDWELPLYEVDEIDPGTTLVELQKLRVHLDEAAIDNLREHLCATYGKFLTSRDVTISLNGQPLAAKFFDGWAYPPGYEPRHYHGELPLADGRVVRVDAMAGLSNESSPASGEYGVYFYCNERLVVRALKTFDVGFMKGYAGLPHPKVSLTKVIVALNGDARDMPWNSSKSDISTKHEVFQAIHAWLNEVVKDFAALSRIWMGDWPDKVFKYTDGEFVDVPVEDFPAARRSYLPPMPKSRPRYGELVTEANATVVRKKPWTRGLYEGVIAADLIAKQRLEQANRIALIVLDSTLEIAFKEYLVNDSGTHYTDANLLGIFGTRHKVHTEIQKYVTLDAVTWGKIKHYSDIRNNLIHRRSTATVSDADLQDFRKVVEFVLKKLYKLKFKIR